MTIAARLRIYWKSGVADESAYLIGASGAGRLAAQGQHIISGRGIVSSMTFSLADVTKRFSSGYAAGALYADLAGGEWYRRKVEFDVSENGGAWTRVFTGYIKSWREENVSLASPAVVNVEARTRDDFLLQEKRSTSLASLRAIVGGAKTEKDILAEWLALAGLAPADYSLDYGVFVIRYAWLHKESVLEDAWQLAAAVGGRIYVDEDGILRYRNALAWVNKTTPVETIDRAQASQLAIEWTDDDLYTRVTAEASGRMLGLLDVVYTPEEGDFVIPAGTTKALSLDLRQPVFSVASISYSAVSTGGMDLSASVTMGAPTYNAQGIAVSFTNAHTRLDAVLRNFRIVGVPIIGAPSSEFEAYASALPFWSDKEERVRAISGNVYIQTIDQAQFVAQVVLDYSKLPAATISLSGVAGKASRRLGQRIRITDPDAYPAGTDAIIVALRWRYDVSGFTQDMEALDVEELFPDEPYFVIGTNVLGAATRPLFY